MKRELPRPLENGEARALRFERFFDVGYRRILAYALRRTSSAADAHDVVAETFAILWRRLDELPEEDRILPWLYGVARRCLANQRRQESRRSRLAEHLGDEPVASEAPSRAAAGEEAHAVRAALGRLRSADQEILRLVAWEELSHREVAEALGVSPNAVAIRIHRARRRLARILLADGILDIEEDEA